MPSLPRPVAQQAISLTGSWVSVYGNGAGGGATAVSLALSQRGSVVAGTYSGEHQYGSVSGLIKGLQVVGTWQGGNNTHGAFSWNLSPDGARFTGSWTGDGTTEAASWSGSREESAAPLGGAQAGKVLDSSGIWASLFSRSDDSTAMPLVLTLAQRGTEVRGSYEGEGQQGTVTGNVQGFTVQGTWVQGSSQGNFTFAFTPDGRNFLGTWDSGANTALAPWVGTRQR